MLKLIDIKKDYKSGDETVHALKGINLQFRESEFVSILGQSGCGKTTLLNIIGGLDRYTTGDLIINGKSTKEFKDKDWDEYRNHSIGFVFQSYNLISHQTVLSNVELALTLSGVSKQERRKRAKEALEKVGLGDQLHKKPNQMSGGQMQRVAIARALVNDPDILLADEPTGALDSATSVQIMEILKEISKDRLIIMVTHNPELAEKYSSRIIKLLDGNVTEDSNPYEASEEKTKKKKVSGKTHMSFITALSLSLNNLLTKKGRTILTAFAGSIGIIGIALIMSLSNGIQDYIQKVEKDTLSSYPITLQETTIDYSTLIESIQGEEKQDIEYEEGKIYSREIMGEMLSTLSQGVSTNNLKEFKSYLESDDNKIKNEYSTAIQYGYNLNLNIYKQDDEGYTKVNPSNLMAELGMVGTNSSSTDTSAMSSVSGNVNIWQEMIDNEELLESQYDLLSGKWPTEYNEVVLVVNDNNELTDYELYSLGLKDKNEIIQKIMSMQRGEKVETSEITSYTYEDLLNIKYKLLLSTDYYQKEDGKWISKEYDENYINSQLDNAVEIKVVGIIKANEEVTSTSINGTIGYKSNLTKYVIDKVNGAEIVKDQKENPDLEIYSKLGIVDLESPSLIYIYPKDFDSKELIAQEIENYNQKAKDEGREDDVINYTDVVGIMINSVTAIINIISYVLIAFVAISLIVSSIMIGIITYISVLERTKEIGILRSIGASKKDISRVFNAETFIVGITAGVIGIAMTLILCIPINIVIKAVSGISGVAVLPITGGLILIAISVILTVIAGLIPAKFAAKKDPVEALRID